MSLNANITVFKKTSIKNTKLRDGDVISSKKSRSQVLKSERKNTLNKYNPRLQVYGPLSCKFRFTSDSRRLSQFFLSFKRDWYKPTSNNINKYKKFKNETRKTILLKNAHEKYRYKKIRCVDNIKHLKLWNFFRLSLVQR